MPKLVPFHAVRYAGSRDLTPLVSPPYDVLDEGPKQALLGRNAHNIVRVDLPVTPPKTVGPDVAYEDAGRVFREWLRDGTLFAEADPRVLFVYEQRWTSGHGAEKVRRGVFAAVEAEDFGRKGGGVHRHELTISGGTADRLKLTVATGAQLSPVFGMLSEADAIEAGSYSITALTQRVAGSREPDAEAVTANDGVRHRLWRVSGEFDALAAHVAARDLYIADGHHRYTTAVNYAAERLGGHGPCLIVLTAIEDPGMEVLPYHRIISGLGAGFDIEAVAARLADSGNGNLVLTEVEVPEGNTTAAAAAATLEAAIAKFPQEAHAVGIHDGGSGRLFTMHSRHPDPIRSASAEGSGHSDAWRALDVAVLKFVYAPALAGTGTIEGLEFGYSADSEEALSRCTRAGPGCVACIVRPTPIESVLRVSDANEQMPPKSTYFFPKLATGLVMCDVEAGKGAEGKVTARTGGARENAAAGGGGPEITASEGF